MGTEIDRSFGNNDVFMDNSTLFESALIIYKSNKNQGEWYSNYLGTQFPSLCSLLESVILHDSIYVDNSFLQTDELAQCIVDDFGGIIKGFNVPYNTRTEIIHNSYSYVSNHQELWNQPLHIEETLLDHCFYEYYGRDDVKILSKIDEQICESECYDLLPEGLTQMPVIFRTYFYFFLSCIYGLPYVPHPARIPLLERADFSQERNSYRRPINLEESIVKSLEKLRKYKQNEINNFIKKEVFIAEFPIISNYVFNRSDSVQDIIENCLDIRDSRNARNFREWCSRVNQKAKEGDFEYLYSAIKEVNGLTNSFIKENRFAGGIQNISLSVYFLSIDFSIPLPDLLSHKKHLLFLRDLSKELLISSRRRNSDIMSYKPYEWPLKSKKQK